MDSNITLVDFCLNTIYKHYLELPSASELDYARNNLYLVTKREKYLNQWKHECKLALKFKEEVLLPETVSNKLLTLLSKKEMLKKCTITLFDRKNTRLSCVRIPDASYLTLNCLHFLKEHKIKQLQINNIINGITNLCDLLNEWTLCNLEVLNISNNYLDEYSSISSKLKNLQELDVSYTNFSYNDLNLAVDSLPNLVSINISQTRIQDITPLVKCRQRLTKLSMFNLQIRNRKFCKDVLLNLSELRHLDISTEFRSSTHIHSEIINSYNCLPYLISLDISGCDTDVTEIQLKEFIEAHPLIEFIGLMGTNLCKSEIFCNLKSRSFFKNSKFYPTNNADNQNRELLQITGTGSLEQVILSMKLYQKRPEFLKQCLQYICNFPTEMKNDSSIEMKSVSTIEVIELVSKIIKKHKKNFPVLELSVFCLYISTKLAWSNVNYTPDLPTMLQFETVNLILSLISYLSDYLQLQEYLLNILCILCETTKLFGLRCVEKVLEVFSSPYYGRVKVEQLCLVILNLVASRNTISLKKTSCDLSQCVYSLLEIIVRELKDPSSHDTLLHSLTLLWNLTENSTEISTLIIKEKGLTLFEEILDDPFHEIVFIEVVGILGNIAEIPTFKHHFMKQKILHSIRLLLYSDDIELSYLAARIVAHLVSDKENIWNSIDQKEFLQQLEDTIIKWKKTDKEIVTYHIFNSCLPFLQYHDMYQTQLFTLWTIQHALITNASKYVSIFKTKSILEILQNMAHSSKFHKIVREQASVLSDNILEIEKKKIMLPDGNIIYKK